MPAKSDQKPKTKKWDEQNIREQDNLLVRFSNLYCNCTVQHTRRVGAQLFNSACKGPF